MCYGLAGSAGQVAVGCVTAGQCMVWCGSVRQARQGLVCSGADGYVLARFGRHGEFGYVQLSWGRFWIGLAGLVRLCRARSGMDR